MRAFKLVLIPLVAAVAAFGFGRYLSEGTEALTNTETTTVLVANQDIGAGTILDPLIDQGVFFELKVPNDSLTVGAVTDLFQLEGQTTSTPIYANEQIPLSRLAAEPPEDCVMGPDRAAQVLAQIWDIRGEELHQLRTLLRQLAPAGAHGPCI